MPWHSKLGVWFQYIFYGILVLVIAFEFMVPEDIFSSALFVDNSGIRPTFSDPVMWFGPDSKWFATEAGVSRSAFGVSVMFFILQMVLSFLAMVKSTCWLETNKTKVTNPLQIIPVLIRVAVGKEKITRFSYNRWGLVISWLVIGFVDTYADAHFRSWGVVSLFWLAYSYVVYSLGSEVMVTLGFSLVSTGILGYLGDRGQTAGEVLSGMLATTREALVGPGPRTSQQRQKQRHSNVPIRRGDERNRNGR